MFAVGFEKVANTTENKKEKKYNSFSLGRRDLMTERGKEELKLLKKIENREAQSHARILGNPVAVMAGAALGAGATHAGQVAHRLMGLGSGEISKVKTLGGAILGGGIGYGLSELRNHRNQAKLKALNDRRARMGDVTES